jgi:hypothetical protein
MKRNFGLNARTIPCQWGTGWRIKIPQAQARLFFDILGPCPVPEMAYKWKIPPISRIKKPYSEYKRKVKSKQLIDKA